MNLKPFFRTLFVGLFTGVLILNFSCSSDDVSSEDNETPVVDEETIDDPVIEDPIIDDPITEPPIGDPTEDPTEEETEDPTEEEEETEDPTEEEIEDMLTCLITLGTDYLVFDAESTKSPLDQWKLIKKGDAGYLDKDGVGPINETHIEFTGNNEGSGPPTSPLDYVFTAPTTGTYKLLMRMYQRLEGAESDKSNDVYVRLDGNFTSGTDKYTTEDLEVDMKFFGRGIDRWGGIYSGEGGFADNKGDILYNLIAGEEYTLTMSGRSQRANIDYILLYDTKDTSIRTGANRDIAEENDARFRPDWDCNNN